MMNMKEFKEYLVENVKEYLPPSYSEAVIDFQEVIKNNDQHLTGIIIKRYGENIIPTIYVNGMFEDYCNGRNIDEIVGDIADIRIKHELSTDGRAIIDQFLDYDQLRDRLQIRVCDTKDNQERLTGLVHSECGDFSATYHVIIDIHDMESSSAAVTPEIMKKWNVSLEQLHQDALAADMKRGPILADTFSMMEELMLGGEARNLLSESNIDSEINDESMYCLTNQDKMHAAGLILQESLLKQIAEIMGDSYFVLPSSQHEVMIVPDRGNIELNQLSSIVQEINSTQIAPEDRLSDQVQYFDKDTGVLENAQKRAERLEKKEKMVPKSIHEKIESKKHEVKSAEKKSTVKVNERVM